MSMSADIDNIINRAITDGVASEEKLLNIKLEIYEALEWDWSTESTAKEMVEKGYEVAAYHLENTNEV